MLSYKKTSKLFYDKFVNKISFTTPVSISFRNKSEIPELLHVFEAYRIRIDKTKSGVIEVGKSWNPKRLSRVELEFATKLVELLLKEQEYGIRVEGTTVGVYTNNDKLVDQIQQICPGEIKEISKPSNSTIKQFLLENPNKIIARTYTHKFKVTFNPLKNNAESFREWCANMPKVKLHTLDPNYEGFFYVSDLKILSLCKIFLGDKIRRVDEIVTLDEIQQATK